MGHNIDARILESSTPGRKHYDELIKYGCRIVGILWHNCHGLVETRHQTNKPKQLLTREEAGMLTRGCANKMYCLTEEGVECSDRWTAST